MNGWASLAPSCWQSKFLSRHQAGRTSWYAWLLGSHPEEPGQGVGRERQEHHEVQPGQMPSRCLGGRALALIPPGLLGQGNSSLEGAQVPVRQWTEQGPATRASSILCGQGSGLQSQGRTWIIPLCSAVYIISGYCIQCSPAAVQERYWQTGVSSADATEKVGGWSTCSAWRRLQSWF